MNATTVGRITRDSEGRFIFTAENASGERCYSTFRGGDGLCVYTGMDRDVDNGVGWKQIVGTAQYPFHETDPRPATFRARVVRYFAQDE